MAAPIPTPILRFVHVDSLDVCLKRGGCHAPNKTPADGLVYRTIHNVDVQSQRQVRPITCGPGVVIHDYVAFYFGPLSPMMLQLKTGQVAGYAEGQEPLIYLVSTAQTVATSGTAFVFSDGHGIAKFTNWFDNLGDLDKIDWNMVNERYWSDDPRGDNDRQRRKQAEFLAHEFVDWSLIQEIVVIDAAIETQVKGILGAFPPAMQKPVHVRREWFYY